MRKYELTIVLGGKTGAAKKKTVFGKVEKAIEPLKGKIEKTEDWGEIELEGKIKKHGSGLFLHFVLELDGSSAKKLENKLRLEEEVIRYLLIRKE